MNGTEYAKEIVLCAESDCLVPCSDCKAECQDGPSTRAALAAAFDAGAAQATAQPNRDRALFAAMAMQGELACQGCGNIEAGIVAVEWSPSDEDCEKLARLSVRRADALLAALKSTEVKP